MLTLLSMIWRGLAIGIMISAPMGPVGILCIQRTLNCGRRTGFYTGVGAALSDILYCLLTGFGLSFIEEFLERNQNIIQLLGSLLLIGFGIYLFKKNPSKSLRRPDCQAASTIRRDILGGFLFTFSNPLILFLIIGLFARFNFLLPEIKFYHYFFGFAAILGGALGWWWVVTYFVNKLRGHFNVRSMWLVNKTIGCIIFIFALVGIISAIMSMSQSAKALPPPLTSKIVTEQWQPADYSNPGAAVLLFTDSLKIPAERDFTFMANVTDHCASLNKRYHHTHPSGGDISVDAPGWGIQLCTPDSTCYLNVCIQPRRRISSILDDLTIDKLSVAITLSRGTTAISDTVTVPHTGKFALIITRKGNSWAICDKDNNHLWECNAITFPITHTRIAAPPGSDFTVNARSMRLSPMLFSKRQTDGCTNTDSLCNILRLSTSSHEGVYAMLDRVTDDNLLRPGGDYRIAVKKSSEGYELIYLSGAHDNSELWHSGMIKGYLYPSPEADRFSLHWFDADALPMTNDLWATFSYPYLILQFPYQQSTIRFIHTNQ